MYNFTACISKICAHPFPADHEGHAHPGYYIYNFLHIESLIVYREEVYDFKKIIEMDEYSDVKVKISLYNPPPASLIQVSLNKE